MEQLEKDLKRAIDYHLEGKLGQADSLYRAILSKDPQQADALQMWGVLAHQQGDSDLAIERMQKSLALNPQQPTAWNNLGNVYSARSRRTEAANCYAKALQLQETYPDAHRNLAITLSEIGQHDRSLAHFYRATELQPHDVASYMAMASILEKQGKPQMAAKALSRACHYEKESPSLLCRLGKLLRRLDQLEDAKIVFRQWLKLEPKHPIAEHFYASCFPEKRLSRASDAYVSLTFDAFAAKYDRALEAAKYAVPDLLQQLVEKHLKSPSESRKSDGPLTIIDAACGSGLCGATIRQVTDRLDGVDLSEKMLALAADRKVYDELARGEMIRYLGQQTDKYDAVVCGDGLPYLGDLKGFLNAAAKALKPNGWLIANIELLIVADDIPDSFQGQPNDDYRLLASGRFSHSPNYVRGLLEKFSFTLCDEIPFIIREEQQPTEGWMFSAKTPEL